MSGRTAAGRKRIKQETTKPPKEPKENGLKGLFSRSKSAAPHSREPPFPSPGQTYPSPPSSARDHFLSTPHGFSGQSPEIRVSRSGTPRGVQALDGYRSPPPSGYSPSPNVTGAYPSPQGHYNVLSPKQLNGYDAPTPRDYGTSPTMKTSPSFHAQSPTPDHFPTPPPHVFLEATYQPPPPSRPRNGRPLPNNPNTGEALHPSPYPPEKVPSPTTPYRPHLPSPARSPVPFSSPSSPPLSEASFNSSAYGRPNFQSSLLLQPLPAPRPRTTSSPVELPRYDSAPGRSFGRHLPQLESPPHPENHYESPPQAYGGGRRVNDGHHPSSADTDSTYATGSLPVVTLTKVWQPNANDGAGGWYDLGVSPHEQAHNLRSPATSSSQTMVPVRPYAESVMSSTSSKKSSSSGSLDKKAPGFVFPGSRSTVKPKISATTGKTKLNITGKKSSKSRLNATWHNDEEVEPTSPGDSPKASFSYGPPSRSLAQSQNSGQSSSGSSRDRDGTNGSVPSHSDDTSTRPRKMSTATTDTGTSKTSSGSASVKSSPGFVYPGGRSRALPSAAPLKMSSFKFTTRSGKHSKRFSGTSSEKGGRVTKFMGITLKKAKADQDDDRPGTPPSPLAFTLASSQRAQLEGHSMYDDGSPSLIESTTSGGGPAGPEFEAYRDQRMSPEVRRQERVRRIKSRIGSYPLDPYDTILLDNDRHTGDLLNRLNGTGSPSFYEYGSDPPATVLDLGCGQGHWVVDAAIAWKGHGTKVTGYDMVDISKVLIPWAVKQGVADNIRFVRGNFLKQRLPFNDNSFDLVRMSSLTLCITADAWIFVFQEVCRVLTVGGRLELIDDGIIFPYGKPPCTNSIPGRIATAAAAPSTPQLSMFAPKIDINIPSSAFTTFSIYDDSDYPNPGLGFPEEDEAEDDDLLDLYQVKEEGESDLDDTATLSGREPEARVNRSTFQRDHMQTPVPERNRSRSRSRAPTQSSSLNRRPRSESWHLHAATSKDLEALFEHMLTHKFGIHMSPEDFVLDLMKDVFGHAREVRTMHLSLAPPDIVDTDDAPRGRLENVSSTKSHDRYGSFGSNFKHIPSPSPARTVNSRRGVVGTPLSRAPGLVLSPATFIPMGQQELEIHASKHLRMLLSAKKFLVEHAMEATEDEEIDEDSVLEALWEYEGFLRARFNHPSEIGGQDKSPSVSDNQSLRESILSVSSDGQDAMWEYQSELRQRFAWPSDGPESPTASRSQIAPKVASPTSANPGAPHTQEQQSQPQLGATSDSHIPSTSASTANGMRSSSPAGSVAPPYSRGELTHVRTFRVYEAIKLDEAMLAMGFGAQ